MNSGIALVGWLAAVALVATPLAAWLLMLRRRQILRARVDAQAGPAFLARLDGGVVHVNAAMAAAGVRTADRARRAIARLVRDADDALVYFMSRKAREAGIAVRPVRSVAGSGAVLTARAEPGGHLLWLLTPAEEDAAAGTGLPALLRGEGDVWVPTPRFAAEIAAPPAAVLERLERVGPGVPLRLALEAPEGPPGRWIAIGDPGEDGAAGRVLLVPEPVEGAASVAQEALFETVPVALAEFTAEGRFLRCNAQAAALLGRQVVPGADFTQLFGPATPGGDLGAAIPPPGERALRPRMAQIRGRSTFVQIAVARRPGAEAETLLVVLTDASQLRQLEDQFLQSQKMEAVGKLAGGVAHDFNNVLTAIVGHCDLLLLRKDASHPEYSDLMQIAQNANRAAALVRQLLAFSRKQTLNPEVLSVRDVITETHYLLGRLVGETIVLRLEIAVEPWAVRADHQQLEQVLMNLVVNARDAMEGTGTISIGLANLTLREPAATPHGVVGDFVEIRVADTGPGLAPGVIDKVFDPFFTTKAKGEGTGLGLSTVYGIIKQSGGHIDASNAEDGGAVFRILLPRAEGAEAAAPVPVPAEPPRRDLSGKGSILLVEDEDPVRAFAARALRLRGYEVFEAATAEDAMTLLEGEAAGVDLLVSDVVMPGMDGPTFAAEARRVVPGLRLIFVSGYAEESFRNNLTEMDFHFLAKPFSLNELTAKVKEVMGEGAPA